MRKRIVRVAAAVSLVALATAANRLSRPLHLAWTAAGRSPPPLMAAADTAPPTALHIPRVKAPPSMVAARRRRPAKAASPVAAPAPAVALPPSIVLVSPPDPQPYGVP